jgi:small subunit ribosomal protein S5
MASSKRSAKPTRQRKQGDLTEKIVHIARVAKVVQGGRRFSFRAAVVIGDGKGKVGFGIGKAGEVVSAVAKGVTIARRKLFEVPLTEHRSIPHEVLGSFKAARVLLKPASAGTGVIAGHHVRAVAECAGITNLLSKSLRSDNTINVVQAALEALRSLKTPAAVPAAAPPSVKAPAAAAAPAAAGASA